MSEAMYIPKDIWGKILAYRVQLEEQEMWEYVRMLVMDRYCENVSSEVVYMHLRENELRGVRFNNNTLLSMIEKSICRAKDSKK